VKNQSLNIAIQYGKRGWPVLPLYTIVNGRCTCGRDDCKSPGKHPRIKNWVEDASTDPDQIKKWWKKWPDVNIGILTGERSGLVVLDIDPRNGGDISLEDIEVQYGKLPETVEVLTGGDGRHLYFQYVDKKFPKEIASGVEIKSDGAYVVAPPSKHFSGKQYAWEFSSHPNENELAVLPDWIISKFLKKSTESSNREDFQKVFKGSRTNKLTQIAGALRRVGLSEIALRNALRRINRDICHPHCNRKKIDEIAKSVSRYEPSQIIPEPSGIPENTEDSRYNTEWENFNQNLFSEQLKGVYSMKQIREKLKNEKEREYLIESLLPRGVIVLLNGAPGSYKTTFSFSLAYSIASGKEFLGLAVQKGKVLYLDMENPPMNYDRLFKKIIIDETPNLHFWPNWGEVHVPRFESSRKNLIQAAKQYDVLIFDSFRDFHSREENSSTDMAVIMDELTKLRKHNVTIILLHHTGKGRDANYRGSELIEANCDISFRLWEKEEGLLELKHLKHRFDQKREFLIHVENGERIIFTNKADMKKQRENDEIVKIANAVKNYYEEKEKWPIQREIIEYIQAKNDINHGRGSITSLLEKAVELDLLISKKGENNSTTYSYPVS